MGEEKRYLEGPGAGDMTQCQMPHGEDGYYVIDRMNKNHRPYIQWSLDNMPDIDPKFILDIGYGGGIFSRLALRKFPKAIGYGIDISEVSYKSAQVYDKYFIDEGRLHLVMGDVRDMPYEYGKFDLVISSESYFFWPDIKDAWKEVVRVMAKGAVLVIPAGGRRITDENYEEVKANTPAPLNVYKDSEVVDMLIEAGLDAKLQLNEDGSKGAYYGIKR
ncbi:SAM-dependent methlyltransferase [methanogenic archaeon mixed culture ISO4-G1]|nr:SAM-dependent methlyltransferase [methanogenic archaeon mixed culture ISO4-G1]